MPDGSAVSKKTKAGPISADRLKSFVERIEKLEEERKAIGSDIKGNLSLASYVLGILAAAFGYRWLAFGIYSAVALAWFIPDLRIVHALEERKEP